MMVTVSVRLTLGNASKFAINDRHEVWVVISSSDAVERILERLVKDLFTVTLVDDTIISIRAALGCALLDDETADSEAALQGARATATFASAKSQKHKN